MGEEEGCCSDSERAHPGSVALTGADRRNTWPLCRRHCISVGRDQHRKLSWLSDVHIIVKSLVIDGLRLGSGQTVPPPPPLLLHNGCAVAALDLQAQINKGCVRQLPNAGGDISVEHW